MDSEQDQGHMLHVYTYVIFKKTLGGGGGGGVGHI